ncbi:ATP-dependent DNA ligase [Infirmifilum sp. NZ]|uniref:ATP-dependent DNA ligase n=1 Tax=Infirmifilum sp. NZ TaxID=2926850 RepID=UPI0027A15488|nr:ATP-dependent DNA ligase [Infirmifilum sp. NZ]UNQ72495.1 ATP-dependent DNA ligase [Infirmifilum sp. NZ]
MALTFSDLVKVAKQVEEKRSRIEKVRVLTSFFQGLTPEEAALAARFLAGFVFPEGDERELGVGYATIINAIRQLRNSRIAPLMREPPTLQEVYSTLDRISKASGEGARERKLILLRGLFSRMSEEEVEYLLRMLFGEVRIGANVGVILESLAKVGGYTGEEIRRGYMLLGDLGELARRVVAREDIRSVSLEIFRPVKPMLADMAYSPLEVLREHSGYTSAEFKYDGVRVQVHVKNGRVEIFSRRMHRITEFLPDVVDKVREHVKAESAVVDGEAVGVVAGRPVAFQELARRFRRKNELRSFLRSVPFQVYFFDILYLNGRMLIDEPYVTRRNLLEDALEGELLARQKFVSSVEELEAFYEEAVREGHEGVVCKQPGSNYEPGVRGKKWLKLKKVDTVDCVIVAAEWGHGRRAGWLSDYYLAVRDENTGGFVVVGKTFKGLTDAEFEEMTRKLLELKTREEGWVVHVKPQIVVEVDYSEIQRSPRYSSGLALRFARIRRIRPDKSPDDITTLQELWRRYHEQRKARIISDA